MKKTRIFSLLFVIVLSVGMVMSGCTTPAPAATTAPTVAPAATTLASAIASAAPAASGDVIKIGAVMPMTGDVSVYGTSTANAINIAIGEINSSGGLLGKQVKLFLEDDQNTPDISVNCYNKLVSEDKVDVIIGSVASKCTLAIAPLAQKDGIPLITTASTNVDVTKAGNFVFRTCFIDPFQGTVGAKFATANLGKKTAAIMFDNGNDYSKGLATAFNTAFVADGGTIVDQEAYSLNDQDYSAIIAKIQDKKPDIIYIPDYYNKDALIAKQIRSAGMTDVILMGGDGWDGIVGNAGTEVSGSYFTNHYDSGSTDPDVQAFVTKYKAAYNDTPNALAALGYDAMEIVAKAITKAGTTDKAAVRDAMAATNGKFVTGNISFDANRNPTKAAVIIQVYTGPDGKIAQKFFATVSP
jgi:branched-chain amino acid transport system substrate-binding protein